MNYHNITKDDMLNGEGLRVVLWLAGCEHHCKGCHNPSTWNPNGGIPFDKSAKQEIFAELQKDYVHGITFSGGDPLHPNNRSEVCDLIFEIIRNYPNKTIWLYTGYTLEEALKEDDCTRLIVSSVDVLVEGRFEKEKADVNYKWAGSTNQRVIDIIKSLDERNVVLYEN